MVNNSTNINTSNKYLDTQKREQRHMTLEIQILALDRHNIVAMMMEGWKDRKDNVINDSALDITPTVTDAQGEILNIQY